MKGTIDRINEWGSGKGCFVVIDGTSFKHFGALKAAPGDSVSFEVKKAATDPNDQDIIHKVIKEDSSVKVEKPSGPSSMARAGGKAMSHAMTKGQTDSIDWQKTRDLRILKSVALKAAVEFSKPILEKDEKLEWGSTNTMDVADGFYAWLKEAV